MGNNSETGARKSLRWFLIKRFLLIMFFIYVSEEAIGGLYEKLTLWTADILSDRDTSGSQLYGGYDADRGAGCSRRISS